MPKAVISVPVTVADSGPKCGDLFRIGGNLYMIVQLLASYNLLNVETGKLQWQDSRPSAERVVADMSSQWKTAQLLPGSEIKLTVEK